MEAQVIDLKRGVVPISKAASALAALINQARKDRAPVIITQKGYPTGVLLTVDDYLALQEAAGGKPPAEETPAA